MSQYLSRDVKRKLRKHDKRFEIIAGSGNGHQWIIFHPDIEGGQRSCPLPDHGGKPISKHVLCCIERRFNLPGDFFK